ncbi:excitatory amino acid transporter 3, partial [Eurytemora carolleeae]|uniref:excitatory amino acid transporter 3 n=1 Tax=Eurytemora carolleeae TaxID=1294199 RepID=UPI000C78D4B3
MKANFRKNCLQIFKSNALTLATLAGVIGGIVLGACLKASREEKWTSREVMYIGYIGQIFLNMLKCVIIPLIIPSLIASVGGLDLSLSKMIGLRAIVYYLTTTVFAVILGIILVV